MTPARIAAVVQVSHEPPEWLLLFVAADAPAIAPLEIGRDVWTITQAEGRKVACKARCLGITINGFYDYETFDFEGLVGLTCRLRLISPPRWAHPRLQAIHGRMPDPNATDGGYAPYVDADVDEGVPATHADILAAAAEAEDAQRDLFDAGDGDGLIGYRGDAIP
ncbi:MAG: hypothetical protein AAGM22_32330 [Acidobacteriota bacterium]